MISRLQNTEGLAMNPEEFEVVGLELVQSLDELALVSRKSKLIFGV